MNRSGELWNAVDFSHAVLRRFLKPDAQVVDATAGNGYDTVFLLDLLGDHGRVLALDIQEHAVSATRTRIASHPRSSQAEVVRASHAHLGELLRERSWTTIDGAVMNCGYLPGGDKTIRTECLSTVDALHALVSVLDRGGIVCVVCYTGHDGGREERDAVRDFCESLSKDGFRCGYYTNPGRLNAPECFCIEHRSDRE